CYTVPEEPIKFDEQNPFPNGAASFTWTVTGEELDKAKTVVFRTLNIAEDLVPENQREIEDISQIGQLTGLSTAYAELLKPEIS
ncbi:hypothetical protein HY642_03195, partial [Candidatus Woesearchaeota archaeon]|nr:hypothetical protein [Candidatus Woesearchaeota archaeon]